MFPMLKSGKINISGAISYAQADNEVTASIAPDAIIKAGGDVTVRAAMEAENNITAVGQTTSDSAAMGGAIAVTRFDHGVKAFIGKNAKVDASGLVEVDASYTEPFAWDDFNFGSTDEVIDSVLELLNVGPINSIFTSYLRNGAAGDKFGLAGSVEVRLNANNVEAFIDEGAQINAGAVRVHASSEINGLHLVGEKVGWSKFDRLLTNYVAGSAQVQSFIARANAVKSGTKLDRQIALRTIDPVKNGIGGSVSFFQLGNHAVARIADGAIIKSVRNVEVEAEASQRTIMINMAQGKAAKLGVHGSAGVLNQNSTSEAYVGDGATIEAGGDLLINAKNDPEIYNIAGGVAKESATSIGASVALNDVDAVTRAFIGNEAGLSGTPTLSFVDASLTRAPSLMFRSVELTGTPTLTFRDNASTTPGADTRDTISRSSGSWITDGFAPGQLITIKGSDANDGYYEIEEVTASTIMLSATEALAEGTTQVVARHAMSGTPVLTFADNESLADKRDTITRDGGSWISDGFFSGQTIRIEGAAGFRFAPGGEPCEQQEGGNRGRHGEQEETRPAHPFRQHPRRGGKQGAAHRVHPGEQGVLGG
jgi:hypothetical protein